MPVTDCFDLLFSVFGPDVLMVRTLSVSPLYTPHHILFSLPYYNIKSKDQ